MSIKRIMLILTVSAMLAALVVTAAPAMASHSDSDSGSVFSDDRDFGDEDDFGDDEDFDDEDGDEIDDVDVEDAFFDGDDVCVLVVTEFEDGSTDVDEECVDIEDAFFDDEDFS